jgi:cell wall assembly regulator SMI1
MNETFLQWVDFLQSNGITTSGLLRPPASDADLAAAEQAMGVALPGALAAFYRIADGQIDPFRADGALPEGMRYAPLFGGYIFNPLAQMVREWEAWQSVRADFNDGTWAEMHEPITLRAGDPPVHREYWRPGWLPFATDGGGNSYAADMDPPPGGTPGQIIVIGSDEDERRVLAPDLPSFLRLTIEAGGLSLDDGDERVVYFLMCERR